MKQAKHSRQTELDETVRRANNLFSSSEVLGDVLQRQVFVSFAHDITEPD